MSGRSSSSTEPESGVRNLCDRALTAFGLASVRRRSELAALRLLIRGSKAAQVGKGRTVAVPRGLRIRPVALLEAWLTAGGIGEAVVLVTMQRAIILLRLRG